MTYNYADAWNVSWSVKFRTTSSIANTGNQTRVHGATASKISINQGVSNAKSQTQPTILRDREREWVKFLIL